MDHFLRYGKDFNAKDEIDYARKASNFLRLSQQQKLPTILKQNEKLGI